MKRDYLNFKREYYFLKSIKSPTGRRVEYEGPIMISERKEYPAPADTSVSNITKFNYSLNVEDDKPMQLYQKTILTDAEGNKSIYLFENPYEENEDVFFPWSLTSKTEGVGEYDLVSTYHWNENRTLKDVIIRKENNGYKSSFQYDRYGNITEINKNILVSIDKENNVSINPEGKEVVNIIKKYEVIDQGNTYLVKLPQYEKIENGDFDVEIWYDYDIDPNITDISSLSQDLSKNINRVGKLNRVRKKVTQLNQAGETGNNKIIVDKKIFYNQYGKPAVTIDGNGNAAQLIYDTVYNIYPTEEIRYPDLDGNILAANTIQQAVNSNSYLASNYLSAEKDYYLDRGQVKWEKDYNGNMKQYEYDLLNRVTNITLPDASTENHDYRNYQTDRINLEKITYHGTGTDSKNDKVIKNIYNASGLLIEKQVKEKEGKFISKYYTYDHLGRIKKETDFENNEIEYKYDFTGETG